MTAVLHRGDDPVGGSEKPIDPALATQAIDEGLRAFPKFAAMKPRLERVQLFKGSMLAVKFEDDQRTKDDPDNFQFEKLVVGTYRSLAGEGWERRSESPFFRSRGRYFTSRSSTSNRSVAFGGMNSSSD